MISKENIFNYAESSFEIAKQFVRDMCRIPAPSHHEEKRANFMKKWFEENGGENVVIDDVFNVICPYNVTEDNDLIVMMAHLDTVFPDLDPMPFEEKDGKMFCPGVTDDTANLAALVTAARYILLNKISLKYGILFIANSCEEGLGNLKGSKQIVSKYGSRIKHFITVDGLDHARIVNQAVGSHRYNIVLRTEGGHSYANFGNRNAIACLSGLITTLYSVKVPQINDSKTTYNVGMINGGTSVNTIAQEASMFFEYRSDNVECLSKMETIFKNMIEAYRSTGIDISVEKIGDRPCGYIEMGNKDNEELIAFVSKAVKEVTGNNPVFKSGSTDANSALAKGIPAVCVSGAVGGLCHTRQEWLQTDSLVTGTRLILEIIKNYCI